MNWCPHLRLPPLSCYVLNPTLNGQRHVTTHLTCWLGRWRTQSAWSSCCRRSSWRTRWSLPHHRGQSSDPGCNWSCSAKEKLKHSTMPPGLPVMPTNLWQPLDMQHMNWISYYKSAIFCNCKAVSVSSDQTFISANLMSHTCRYHSLSGRFLRQWCPRAVTSGSWRPLQRLPTVGSPLYSQPTVTSKTCNRYE